MPVSISEVATLSSCQYYFISQNNRVKNNLINFLVINVNMALVRGGTVSRSAGLPSAIQKQVKLINLKAVKRITVTFDPLNENAVETRYVTAKNFPDMRSFSHFLTHIFHKVLTIKTDFCPKLKFLIKKCFNEKYYF